VLDTSRGRPAAGVRVRLEHGAPGGAGVWAPLAEGATDAGGRAGALLPPGARAAPGLYRLRFDVGAYEAAQRRAEGSGGSCQTPFFPEAAVSFEIAPGQVCLGSAAVEHPTAGARCCSPLPARLSHAPRAAAAGGRALPRAPDLQPLRLLYLPRLLMFLEAAGVGCERCER
jgi:5-hydroxyisourate hydrolase-like protein (transthyretin family)